jgi:RNA polymerase-binding transcription factor DksA
MKQKQEKVETIFCELCGRKIPKERIKALPQTTMCVHCASEAESNSNINIISLCEDYDTDELLDAISSDD